MHCFSVDALHAEAVKGTASGFVLHRFAIDMSVLCIADRIYRFGVSLAKRTNSNGRCMAGPFQVHGHHADRVYYPYAGLAAQDCIRGL